MAMNDYKKEAKRLICDKDEKLSQELCRRKDKRESEEDEEARQKIVVLLGPNLPREYPLKNLTPELRKQFPMEFKRQDIKDALEEVGALVILPDQKKDIVKKVYSHEVTDRWGKEVGDIVKDADIVIILLNRKKEGPRMEVEEYILGNSPISFRKRMLIIYDVDDFHKDRQCDSGGGYLYNTIMRLEEELEKEKKKYMHHETDGPNLFTLEPETKRGLIVCDALKTAKTFCQALPWLHDLQHTLFPNLKE